MSNYTHKRYNFFVRLCEATEDRRGESVSKCKESVFFQMPIMSRDGKIVGICPCPGKEKDQKGRYFPQGTFMSVFDAFLKSVSPTKVCVFFLSAALTFNK